MVLVLVPVLVTASGLLVRVQVPEDGRPSRGTLPVGTAQVGWVMVPTVGAPGAPGTASITTDEEEADTQPAALVTV
jgi:hypothetical protein